MSMMQSRRGWTEDAPVLQWKIHLKIDCITVKGNIMSLKNSAKWYKQVRPRTECCGTPRGGQQR